MSHETSLPSHCPSIWMLHTRYQLGLRGWVALEISSTNPVAWPAIDCTCSPSLQSIICLLGIVHAFKFTHLKTLYVGFLWPRPLCHLIHFFVAALGFCGISWESTQQTFIYLFLFFIIMPQKPIINHSGKEIIKPKVSVVRLFLFAQQTVWMRSVFQRLMFWEGPLVTWSWTWCSFWSSCVALLFFRMIFNIFDLNFNSRGADLTPTVYISRTLPTLSWGRRCHTLWTFIWYEKAKKTLLIV